MSQAVLVLGATSDIARALSRLLAEKGHELILAGRNTQRIQADVSDLSIKYGVKAQAVEFDASQTDTHQAFFEQLNPKPEVVVCVFGNLFDQEKAEQDWRLAEQMLQVNFLGAASILHHAANHFQARGQGTIVGISSVAGDRGRASNYYYGSAKAGFSAYLSGLRNRLSKHGVHVLTVKPGFVATAMTEGMDLPGPITAQPEQVAKDILIAIRKRKNVLYTLWMWRYIMLIIRSIPENIFKKLSL